MANRTLFKSQVGPLIPATNTINHERAPAYAFSPRHALAQLAVTGTLNSTFYTSAAMQLKGIMAACKQVDAVFIAKTAVFSRRRGFMKDVPALLCAVLAVRSPVLLRSVFHRVIDNGKMLRNFVQIMRSGVIGRKSLGTLPKRLILDWLAARSDDAVFRASVGRQPSLADIIRMVHPKPATASRETLFGYLLGRLREAAALPALVRHYEAFKAGQAVEVPDVPFEKLTSLDLGQREWIAIARHAGWHMTRMNLNTFTRHGVLRDTETVALIAARLRDPEAIARARVFPYQLLVAYMVVGGSMPDVITEALQEALEIATYNVPRITGKVYICPDVSGSMTSPVTGFRRGATTGVCCVDIAGLIAATILRKNPDAEVIPFNHCVQRVWLNPRDSIMTNAAKLAAIGGGGTNCSAPLALLNMRRAYGDLIIYVSDNQSWVDSPYYGRLPGSRTAMMQEWNAFKRRNKAARLVCIDIQPYRTTQAAEQEDILNIGGFSDQVFTVVSEFADGRLNPEHWLGVIEAVEL